MRCDAGLYKTPVQEVDDLRQRLIDARVKALWTALSNGTSLNDLE